jgi:hypothetical protein
MERKSEDQAAHVAVLEDFASAYSPDSENGKALRAAIVAMKQQAEAPKLIGWRTDNYLMETADRSVAMNWECHYRILPIFAGDPNTKLAAPTEASR